MSNILLCYDRFLKSGCVHNPLNYLYEFHIFFHKFFNLKKNNKILSKKVEINTLAYRLNSSLRLIAYILASSSYSCINIVCSKILISKVPLTLVLYSSSLVIYFST